MALATQKEVEALAENITQCADSIHDRLMTAIKNKEIDQYNAQSVFQGEATLRQYANKLFIEAIEYVVAGLENPQDEMIGLIDSAKEKIKAIKEMAGFIDLVADLVVFAAAVSAAKPAAILAALKEVKEDVDALGKGSS